MLFDFLRNRKGTINAAIAYKNFAAYKGISHIGLGVTGMTNAKVLNEAGYKTQVWAVTSNVDIVNRLKAADAAGAPITHLVISAPWVSTYDLTTMAHAFPHVKFAVISHSNFGFLQADPSGVRLLREAADLSVGLPNFAVGGNSKKFVDGFTKVFSRPAVYLPNMYYLNDDVIPKPKVFNGGTLRIGCFGAVRPLKNTISSAAAALIIARRYHADLEFWVSGGRFEGGGDVVFNAMSQMYANLPHAKIVQAPWRPWSSFREVIRHMHLLMQVSYTESFNMVTADGIAEGITTVTSHAIDWVPQSWQAYSDNVSDIAETGVNLLDHSRYEARCGLRALREHNEIGLRAWAKYFHGRA